MIRLEPAADFEQQHILLWIVWTMCRHHESQTQKLMLCDSLWRYCRRWGGFSQNFHRIPSVTVKRIYPMCYWNIIDITATSSTFLPLCVAYICTCILYMCAVFVCCICWSHHRSARQLQQHHSTLRTERQRIQGFTERAASAPRSTTKDPTDRVVSCVVENLHIIKLHTSAYLINLNH